MLLDSATENCANITNKEKRIEIFPYSSLKKTELCNIIIMR